VSRVLLTILNEVLDDITEEMRTTQTTLEEHKVRVQDVQEEIQRVTSQQECALYEHKQAMQRSEVLRTYLGRPGEYPRVLVGKMKKLSDEQERTAHSCDEVDRLLVRVRTDLQGKQTELAVAEQRYAELREWWGDVSERILSIQRAT
jgi:septal ring factor EnvC (AmiA/AmiB activator)